MLHVNVRRTNLQFDICFLPVRFQTAPMLGNYHTHSVLALTQSLMSILEFALYNVYVPLGGLVELASTWYRLFQQQSQRVRETF